VPLQRKKILVTREKKQAKQFAKKIRAHNGIPVEIPLIQIKCHKQMNTTYELKDLSAYDWIFFTSANGVNCFFSWLNAININYHHLSGCKWAVVGHKTERALKTHGYFAHFIPTTYNAKTLAHEFSITYPKAQSILLVQGNLAKETLQNKLLNFNYKVDRLDVYQTIENVYVRSRLNSKIKEGIDSLTFTSPSTVDAFINMLDDLSYKKIVCTCIGTTTEKRAREKGIQKILVPNQFTIDGMIERISAFLKSKG